MLVDVLERWLTVLTSSEAYVRTLEHFMLKYLF
jgi:hypothetical protein